MVVSIGFMDTTIRRWFAVVSGARAKNCFDALQEALQGSETLRIVATLSAQEFHYLKHTASML
jgi:hypothetical protein